MSQYLPDWCGQLLAMAFVLSFFLPVLAGYSRARDKR